MEPQGVTVFEEFATAEAMRLRDTTCWNTYVALEGINVVGVLHVREGKHISMFFVLTAYQKQGIGRALIDVADLSGRLESVNSSVNATSSYEAYGFGVCGPVQLGRWHSIRANATKCGLTSHTTSLRINHIPTLRNVHRFKTSKKRSFDLAGKESENCPGISK